MDKLNEKMLEFAGFKKKSYHLLYDPKCSYWEAPDGSHFLESLPDFTHDLNACEKWLFPILKQQGYSIELIAHLGNRCQARIATPDSFCEMGTIYSECAEILATAFCLAVEKLMEAKKKIKDASEVTGIYDITGDEDPVEFVRRQR